ncbi:MAG TPA: family 20 glycosylhydrolase, partial [Isosphaeraceae bacterium]|nr:family 20 glycosylhydrolase [Isosphaeraceae bacterium]
MSDLERGVVMQEDLKTMRTLIIGSIVGTFLIVSNALADEPPGKAAPIKVQNWRGLHLPAPGPGGLPRLRQVIVEKLAPMGVNVIVLEINYKFQFALHPELADSNALSKDDARALAALCREHGIRLIPQFNCLGHQSWSGTTFSLLTKYPELDETPETPRTNKGIYCRSWCPLNPKVNPIIFALMDDLIDAFEADAFHVGMDEVFIVASPQCPRCKGKDPAEVFAQAVNDYHKHLVDEKKLTMLMWGDRLLDDRTMHYGEWESSRNGTAPAADQVPKDIIICDWHYERMKSYPSLPFLQEKGFRVWPASWRNKDAALALIEAEQKLEPEHLVGHLCTSWGST